MTFKFLPVGWTDNLARIISVTPFTAGLPLNPRQSTHGSGHLWKFELGRSLSADLSTPGVIGRTFVRLVHSGISGVVLYEIPSIEDEETGRRNALLDLHDFFGRDGRGGMTQHDLLDCIGAKMLYFPSYSCTSFATGLAVTAAYGSKRFTPECTNAGLTVNPSTFTSFDSQPAQAYKPIFDVSTLLTHYDPPSKYNHQFSSVCPTRRGNMSSDEQKRLWARQAAKVQLVRAEIKAEPRVIETKVGLSERKQIVPKAGFLFGTKASSCSSPVVRSLPRVAVPSSQTITMKSSEVSTPGETYHIPSAETLAQNLSLEADCSSDMEMDDISFSSSTSLSTVGSERGPTTPTRYSSDLVAEFSFNFSPPLAGLSTMLGIVREMSVKGAGLLFVDGEPSSRETTPFSTPRESLASSPYAARTRPPLVGISVDAFTLAKAAGAGMKTHRKQLSMPGGFKMFDEEFEEEGAAELPVIQEESHRPFRKQRASKENPYIIPPAVGKALGKQQKIRPLSKGPFSSVWLSVRTV